MPSYRTVVRPGGTGPLDQVEAYIDDSGAVHLPGEEGYVERPAEGTGEVYPPEPEAKSPLELADELGGGQAPPEVAS